MGSVEVHGMEFSPIRVPRTDEKRDGSGCKKDKIKKYWTGEDVGLSQGNWGFSRKP